MSHLTPSLLGISIYIWIMVVFLVILVIILILGADFDFDFDADIDSDVGTGVSPLSLPVIALFGTGFGGVAAVLDTLHVHIALVVLPAGFLAAAMAGGMYFVMYRVFVKTQSSSDVVLPELIGREANVTIPIGPGKTGQVLVITAERGRTLVPAISSEEIPTNQAVVIESVVGNTFRVRRVD
jgi:membrane-bound ClpP family serine protease